MENKIKSITPVTSSGAGETSIIGINGVERIVDASDENHSEYHIYGKDDWLLRIISWCGVDVKYFPKEENMILPTKKAGNGAR